MFGTLRRRADTSLVYHTEEPGTSADLEESNAGDQAKGNIEEPVIERGGENGENTNGEVFSHRPERAPNARNAHGSAATAAKGSIDQFSGIPNSRPKGNGASETLFLRCG